jgi:PPOX class probable F420-dependent enzyme
MELNRAEIDAFLAEAHTLVLATLRRDGTPHLATVWYRWDGRAFWIATNQTTVKYRNLVREPRVTVLVDAPPRETSVMAYCRADVLARGDDAYDGAITIVGRYVADPVAYIEERRDEPRALIRMTPSRITSWRA